VKPQAFSPQSQKHFN